MRYGWATLPNFIKKDNKMNFLDLTEQYKSIKKEIDLAIERVLESGCFVGGQEVNLFEKELAEFAGAKYGISVNSGTDGLYLSLRALGIGEGDEVITTPFTFFATAEAIANCKAKPVFADIDINTLNIDSLKVNITKKTRAVIPVHLFGRKAEIKNWGVPIIEDSAQAIGIKLSGDLACFSFFPSKNLGAYGDGGMIVTNNSELADKIRLLKNHGSDPKSKYLNLMLGTNSRLDSLQAAILSVKLKHIAEWNKKRTQIAERYNAGLKNVVKTPKDNGIFHQYTVLAERRDQLKVYLEQNKIPTMIYYPIALHLQPAFKYLGYKKGDMPGAELACEKVLSLPIYPEITKEDQNYIIKKINDFYGNSDYSLQE